MPTIDLSGTTIAFIDTGQPVGRTDADSVVFGHGTLFGGWMFREQISELKSHYRCIAIDFPAHGDTPATRSGYDMDTLTAHAAALITALGVGPVHWIGLSSGGFVGLRLALRHGDLLRSLTLLDTCANAAPASMVRRSQQHAVLFRLVGPNLFRYTIAPLMFSPLFRSTEAGSDLINEWLERLHHSNRRGIAMAMKAAMARTSLEGQLDAIRLPTLVAVASNDAMTPPRLARQMADRITNSTFEIIADSGHCSTLEQPAALTDLLKEFLQTHCDT